MVSSIKSGGGTSIRGIRPEMAIAHNIIDAVFAKYDTIATITSGTDSKHGKGSLHFVGLALDYRIRELREVARATMVPMEKRSIEDVVNRAYESLCEKVCADMRASLGEEFDVVLEFEKLHIHVEFQPKYKLNSR